MSHLKCAVIIKTKCICKGIFEIIQACVQFFKSEKNTHSPEKYYLNKMPLKKTTLLVRNVTRKIDKIQIYFLNGYAFVNIVRRNINEPKS